MNKKLLVPLILVFVVSLVSAQVGDEGKEKILATKLELFLAEKGQLTVKEFFALGKVSGGARTKTELTAVVIYEPGEEDERLRGLKIEVINAGGSYVKRESSFLDLEEIEGLLKAIDYVVSLSKEWEGVQKEYTEVVFSTKDDFRVGFYQRGIKQKAFVSSGTYGREYCRFSMMDKLRSLKVMAGKGLKLLSEK